MLPMLLKIICMERNVMIRKIKNVSKRIIKELDIVKSKMVGKKSKRMPFTFEVHIIDSCNLNCAGCSHFSPLAKADSAYPLEEYEKDLTRMGELFANNVKRLRILGGEPLINPRVCEYLEISRKCLPNANLELVTNGTLLERMPQEFFDSCVKNNIKIRVSVYPIKFDYDKVEKYVKAKGVNIEIYGVRSNDDSWMSMGLSKTDLLDYKKTFLECPYANDCINLIHGKLCFCSNAAYISIFNEFFGESYDDSNTCISIHEHTRDEILEFLRTPNEFCKYCHVNDNKNTLGKWSVSKKEKQEWTKNY